MKKVDEEFLTEVRRFLIPKWKEKQQEIADKKQTSMDSLFKSDDDQMCRFTSLFLAKFLMANAGGKWRVAGGDVWEGRFSTGGYLGNDGNWHGHYWVTNGKTIIDITTEQFGGQKIHIVKASDERYADNYTKSELKEHMSHVKGTVDLWMGESLKIFPRLSEDANLSI